MSDEQDKEVIAAHAYRDGKIFFTVTITRKTELLYLVNREDNGFLLAVGRSEAEAMVLADMYLLGITTGYDLGIEHASKERAKHERTDADKRTSYRNLRVSGRGPAFPSERGD